MFCNGCGQQLAPGQRFCAQCGQPVGVAAIPSRGNRVAEHVKLLGIISIAYSALVLLGGIIVFLVANTLFSLGASDLHGAAVPGFLHPLLGLVGIALLARGALGVVAGWGLLEYAPWARLLSLILGFISLLSVPFGTALGIYTIWVLLASNAEKQYQALA